MKLIVATAASGALALGAPTAAYANGDDGGILTDVVADNNVQANICDTNVNAVASQETADKTNCQNKVQEDGHGGGGVLSDVVAGNNVQANVCDTNVNAVASQQSVDKTNCQNKVQEAEKEKKREKPEEKKPEEKPEEEDQVKEAAPAQPEQKAPQFAG